MLEVFGISAYHFYKLIEVAIKLESSFPRGIIKHLNRVRKEEKELIMKKLRISLARRELEEDFFMNLVRAASVAEVEYRSDQYTCYRLKLYQEFV